MSDREWQIGICGTFDVENYGDLLFPLIAEAELQRRLGRVTLHRFSYRTKTAGEWPYTITSLAELPAAAGDLDALLVGGGIMVRFDKSVAADYAPPAPHMHHPTGYWLSPMLIALQHGCPVVWNSPGALGDIPAWAEPLLELVISQSSYVGVRDEYSQQLFGRLAHKEDVRIVPDTAFGLAGLIDVERPSVGFARLRETLGLRAPYVVVQATTGLEAFTRFARSHPQVLQDHQIVILPTGPVNGDDPGILADDLPEGIPVTTWPHPLATAELIAHAAAAVGVSLHLAITAVAFGVPVFRPAHIFGMKYAMLLRYGTVHPFADEPEIDPQWFAARLGRAEPASAMPETLRRLCAHWDSIASIVVAGRSPARVEALGRSWQSMPGWLENSAVQRAATLSERDAVRAERDVLLAERDAWADRSAAAQAERQAIRAERDALLAERDAWADRCAAAQAERHAIRAERDALLVERDAWADRCAAAQAERHAIRAERDAMLNEREALRASTSWRITAPLRALRRALRFGMAWTMNR
jgi:lipopolysaccharide transport system ATP-binding protein